MLPPGAAALARRVSSPNSSDLPASPPPGDGLLCGVPARICCWPHASGAPRATGPGLDRRGFPIPRVSPVCVCGAALRGCLRSRGLGQVCGMRQVTAERVGRCALAARRQGSGVLPSMALCRPSAPPNVLLLVPARGPWPQRAGAPLRSMAARRPAGA